jgi:hypothetical protein
MSKVFIGGSRQISRLNDEIRRRLDQIVQRQLWVLVGDANGADRAVQAFFHERRYPNVTVFCTGAACRNNVGGWQVRLVTPPHKTKDFGFFTAKDLVMAGEADAALMLWDGESAGTIVNLARLLARGKISVVYLAPQKVFRTLKSASDLRELLALYPPSVTTRLDRYIAEHAGEYLQSGFFEGAA